MMKRTENYTHITPLPSFIPRHLAIDILHSHSEIITLNPLVLSHKAIPAPRDAPSDEYYSTWYEISERIQVVPGAGRLGGSKISFRTCFHDIPTGVQTHAYAPMGIDLRHNYRVAGTQPGEPAEYRELGINAPATGLYLREDIQIRCNFAMVSFVKSQLKSATKVLVDRLIKKAELLDAGVLQAMMENGKLRTINPADRSQQSPPLSPRMPLPPVMSPPQSPHMPSPTTGHYRPDDVRYHQLDANDTRKTFLSELPGDTRYTYDQHLHPNQTPATTHKAARDSTQSMVSQPSANGWSYASSQSSASTYSPSEYHGNRDSMNMNMRPASTTSTIAPFVLVDDGTGSHGPGKRQFAAELPGTQE